MHAANHSPVLRQQQPQARIRAWQGGEQQHRALYSGEPIKHSPLEGMASVCFCAGLLGFAEQGAWAQEAQRYPKSWAGAPLLLLFTAAFFDDGD